MDFGAKPPGNQAGDTPSDRSRFTAMGRVAAVMAHEINNQLTVINGRIQMLRDRLPMGDPSRADAEEISRAGERAAALVRDFLAAGRPHAPSAGAFDLHALLEESRPTLAALLDPSVHLNLELSAAHAFVRGGKDEFEQVLLNLALNARDAMPTGGILLIRTEDGEGGVLRLIVADTGTGMDEATRLRVFDPFFTTKGAGRGVGLGLTVVRDTVESNGGTIRLDSAPAAGARFRISLPCVSDSGSPSAVQGGSEALLIVSSDRERRDRIAAALASYGYGVLAAGRSDAAVALAAPSDTLSLLLVADDPGEPHACEAVARLRDRHPKIKMLCVPAALAAPDLARKVRDVLDEALPKARVVVTDDEPSVRRFLRSVLESAGYAVVEAAEGGDALKHVRRGGIDLVLTDILMPGREGLETIAALRKECPGVQVVAMSGAANSDYLRMARALGAAAALPKPIRPGVLLAAVAKALQPEIAQ